MSDRDRGNPLPISLDRCNAQQLQHDRHKDGHEQTTTLQVTFLGTYALPSSSSTETLVEEILSVVYYDQSPVDTPRVIISLLVSFQYWWWRWFGAVIKVTGNEAVRQ